MLTPLDLAPPAEIHQPADDDVPAWVIRLSWAPLWAGVGVALGVGGWWALVMLVTR